MTLPPHSAKPPEQPKPNVQWTLMPPPHVAFQMWADGSIKIIFGPHLAAEVIQCFENHLTAFRTLKGMIDNPPKKCPNCRGTGQIMVKVGNEKKAEVCKTCHGSGKMGFVPPSVGSAPAAPQAAPEGINLEEDDVEPSVNLPHEQLPPLADPDTLHTVERLLRNIGYKVVPLTKEETAAQLAQTTSEGPKTEPAPSDENEDTSPGLSLSKLSALGNPPTSR